MKISFTELKQLLADDAELKALRLEREALKKQVMDLLAGDAEVAAQVQAVFDKSETVEGKMRAGVAGR
jgi:cell division protein FtsB